MVQRGLAVLFAINLLSTNLPSAQPPQCTAEDLRSALDGLVYLQPVEAYFSDGAADGSVMIAGPDYSPHPSIRPLLVCIGSAAAVLVEHLDDPRPTGFLFRTGKDNMVLRQASLGHVALDILIVTANEASGVHVEECHDDGLGACVVDGYYFRPDAWSEDKSKNVIEPAPEVEQVKGKWRELLDSGRLQLEIPDWLAARWEP